MERIHGAVSAGAHLLVTYFSGIVDGNDRVHPGAYPGAFRELLGIVVEEFAPLPRDATVALDDGSVGTVWSERMRVTEAEPIARYADGPAAGWVAVSRSTVGSSSAWYVGTRLDQSSLDRYLDTILGEAGVAPIIETPDGAEAVLRVGETAQYLFLLNHHATPAEVATTGTDLLTGTTYDGVVPIDGFGVRVLRQP